MLTKAMRFLFCLFLSVTIFARNGFLVAPTHLDLDCEKPTTASFVVTNTGSNTIHIRISPQCYPTGSPSLPLGKDLIGKNLERVCVSKFLLVSPRAVSLTPGAKRTVRISLRPPPHLALGGYRAHLLFAMLENANTVSTHATMKMGRDMNMKLNILFEMAVGIYCSKGEGDAVLSASCKKSAAGPVVEFVNKTPWRYKGSLQIIDKASNKTQPPQRMIMLRESRQDFPITGLKKKGSAVTVKWTPKDGYKDKGQISCKVP